MAQSYANPQGTGDRRASILVTADAGPISNAGASASLVDGSQTINSSAWFNSTSNWVRFDFGYPRVIDEAKWYQSSGSSHGTWKWQVSDDATTWADVGASFVLGGVALQTHTALAGNVSAYRFWRIVRVSGTPSSGPYLLEVEFRIDESSEPPPAEPTSYLDFSGTSWAYFRPQAWGSGASFNLLADGTATGGAVFQAVYGGPGSRAWEYEGLPAVADFDIRASFFAETLPTFRDGVAGLFMRGDAAWSERAGFHLYVTKQGTVTLLHRRDNNDGSYDVVIGSQIALPALVTGERVWLRWSMTGTAWKIKAWKGVEADEPAAWQTEGVQIDIIGLSPNRNAYVNNATIPAFGVNESWNGKTRWDTLELLSAVPANTPPPAPVITSPAAGATVAAAPLTLTVTQDPDADGDPITHRSRHSPAGAATWTENAGLTVDLSGYAAGASVDLQAIAHDGTADSPWSATVTVTIQASSTTGGSPTTQTEINDAGAYLRLWRRAKPWSVDTAGTLYHSGIPAGDSGYGPIGEGASSTNGGFYGWTDYNLAVLALADVGQAKSVDVSAVVRLGYYGSNPWAWWRYMPLHNMAGVAACVTGARDPIDGAEEGIVAVIRSLPYIGIKEEGKVCGGGLGVAPAELVLIARYAGWFRQWRAPLPAFEVINQRCGTASQATVRLLVTRTADAQLVMQASATGTGAYGPINPPAGGWHIDVTLDDPELSGRLLCGYAGACRGQPQSVIGGVNASAYASFGAVSVSVIEREASCAVYVPGEPDVPPPAIEADPPEALAECEPPAEPIYPDPSSPCALILEVYDQQGVLVEWAAGTDPAHPAPYLMQPEHYGEQEVDFAEGRASIGTVTVGVIDPPIVAGDQAGGWLTQRLADAGGRTAITGRRCRLLRYVDEIIGWVVIADGPAGAPVLAPSYAAYGWTIRDTRETERKAKAFETGGTSTVLPRGVLFGYGLQETGEYVVQPTQSSYYLTGVFSSVPGAPEIQYVDVIGMWPDTGSLRTERRLVLTDEMAAIMTATVTPTGTNDPVSGDPVYTFRWPDIAIWWRLAGGTEWTVIDDVYIDTAAQPSANGPWWSNPADQTRSIDRLYLDLRAQVDYTDEQGDTQTLSPVRGIRGVQIHAGNPADVPDIGDNVDVMVVHTGTPTEHWPLHIETTAGQLLRELYCGFWSPRDAVTGGIVPTGIRYDPDALDAMMQPVRLRITKPVDDIRAWAEEMIYRPLGYAPALDNDGRISPVSQEMPGDLSAALEITDDVAAPQPGWGAGENVLNVLEWSYPRDYRSDPRYDPEGEGGAGDTMASRELELEYRQEESVTIHGEKKVEIAAVAFRAVSRFGGDPWLGIEDEISWQLFQARRLHLIGRTDMGAPVYTVHVRRAVTAALRAGDWVRPRMSWMPEYATLRRALAGDAQIIAIADLDCAWRRLTMEAVSGVPRIVSATLAKTQAGDCATPAWLQFVVSWTAVDLPPAYRIEVDVRSNVQVGWGAPDVTGQPASGSYLYEITNRVEGGPTNPVTRTYTGRVRIVDGGGSMVAAVETAGVTVTLGEC